MLLFFLKLQLELCTKTVQIEFNGAKGTVVFSRYLIFIMLFTNLNNLNSKCSYCPKRTSKIITKKKEKTISVKMFLKYPPSIYRIALGLEVHNEGWSATQNLGYQRWIKPLQQRKTKERKHNITEGRQLIEGLGKMGSVKFTPCWRRHWGVCSFFNSNAHPYCSRDTSPGFLVLVIGGEM